MRVNSPLIYLQRRSLSSVEGILKNTSQRFLGSDVINSPDNSLTLSKTPIPETVVCVVSGVVLTYGDTYDYIVSGNKILFSSGIVFENDMNIIIYYQYVD